MDAALLAAAVDRQPGERLIEAGCGFAGAVCLMQVAARRKAEAGRVLIGLELRPDRHRTGARERCTERRG